MCRLLEKAVVCLRPPKRETLRRIVSSPVRGHGGVRRRGVHEKPLSCHSQGGGRGRQGTSPPPPSLSLSLPAPDHMPPPVLRGVCVFVLCVRARVSCCSVLPSISSLAVSRLASRLLLPTHTHTHNTHKHTTHGRRVIALLVVCAVRVLSVCFRFASVSRACRVCVCCVRAAASSVLSSSCPQRAVWLRVKCVCVCCAVSLRFLLLLVSYHRCVCMA